MKRFIPIKYYISIVKDKLKEELKCYNTRPHLGAIYFGDNQADVFLKKHALRVAIFRSKYEQCI